MPANGSSSSMKRGRAASARAISTRRRSPPERLTPFWSAMWPICRSSSSDSSSAVRPAPSRSLRSSRIARMLSATLRRRNTEGFLRQIADAQARARVHRHLGHVDVVEADACRHRRRSGRRSCRSRSSCRRRSGRAGRRSRPCRARTRSRARPCGRGSSSADPVALSISAGRLRASVRPAACAGLAGVSAAAACSSAR